MKTSYALRAYRQAIHAYLGPAQQLEPLTASVLRELFRDAVISTVAPTGDGGYDVELSLDRPSHDVALDELRNRLMAAGWVVAETAVSQWVVRSVETGVAGAALGLGGGARTKNPLVVLIATALGYGVGYLVGQYIHQEIARFRARHDPMWGVWQFTKLELPTQPRYRFMPA